jgi:hypothetical protein
MITGSDSDLSQIPGFAATGLFPIYLTGAAGYVFNFADTWSDRSLQAPHMFWLAHKFGQKVYAWYAQTYVSNPESADPGGAVGPSLGLVWFQPDRDPVSEGLPLDKHFRGTEVATFRSAWNDPDGVFLGFKAGDNRVNHSHLDIGSFVLDALGQRWALDLGKDDYSLSGYFEKYSGQRWTYYRMRAEGHNTLVLNPSSGPDQNPAATAKITRFESNANKKFAIADLTPAYGQTLQRGIALLNGDSVIVQDELFPSRPTQLWWFMHTSAEIELSGDERSATLKHDSARLWCAIASPPQASFTAMDAKPLPTSPNPSGQDQNQGIRKLAIHISDPPLSIPFTLSVTMIPLNPSQEIPAEVAAVEPLAKWYKIA